MKKVFMPSALVVMIATFFVHQAIAQPIEKKIEQEIKGGVNSATDKHKSEFRLSIADKDFGLFQTDEFLTKKIPSEILSGLGSFIRKELSPTDLTLLASDTSFYLMQGCSFDVLQWRNNEWKSFYQYDNSGYTCGSYFFERDGQISALGSNGFWNAQADWLFFDQEFGSWELMKTKNQPLGYSTYLKGIGPSYAYYLNANYQNNRVKDYISVEPQSYVLDLENKSWHEVNFGKYYSLNSKKTPFFIGKVDEYAISTENYMVIFAQRSSDGLNGFLLFDKSDWQLKFVASPIAFSDYKLGFWRMIYGDKVRFLSSMGRTISLDIQEIYDQAELVGELKVIQEKKNLELLASSPVLVFANLIFIILAIIFYRKWKITQKSDHVKVNKSDAGSIDMNGVSVSELYNQFIEQKALLLSIDELDELFGIDGFKNLDSRKATRARILKKVNNYAQSTTGEPLITRERSVEDRRQYVYRINMIDK